MRVFAQNNAKNRPSLNDGVHWAMQCVSIVSYSVLLNREPHDLISPSHGIKQSDHLSPYLFLFCTEGLSALLPKAVDTQQIKGLWSHRNGVSISHLLFADDSLLFFQALPLECARLLQILGQYEQGSS